MAESKTYISHCELMEDLIYIYWGDMPDDTDEVV